jgi:peptidoglycan hydrolase-like protein with peptidoglycan-binding domain
MARRKKKSAMTASTLTQLPIMAGSALLSSAVRTGQWAFTRYMRAPAASTALLALVTMSALAGSNALYFQTSDHPAPFFAPARGEVAALPTPVAERPEVESGSFEQVAMPSALPALAAPSAETTGSVSTVATIPDGPVGNAEVFAVQKRLAELNFFSGTVDGYYGPKTAQAIRAFEQHNNLPLKGALDPAVVQAILGSNGAGLVTTPAAPQARMVAPAPAPTPVAAPVAVASIQTQPAAPAPVVAPPQDTVVAVLPQLSPAEQAFDQVAVSAANTLDSIIAAVDSSRTPPEQMAAPPIPTASVPAAQPMPAPVQPVAQIATTQPVAQASAVVVPPANDTDLVMRIQRGLASLGFFRAPVDGKPGPETARAIREFENFHSYRMTGQVKPDLVELLVRAGAVI